MPFRSINVAPINIWEGYNQALSTIGQGIADYITEQRKLKQAKRLEEETYQLGRQREEKEYRLGRSREEEELQRKKQREREEADAAREQARKLLTKKYQGYQLKSPPLSISEMQPLTRAGQRLDESPSSLAHLLRARLEEMTPEIVEKTEEQNIPPDLGKGIYGDIIKKALIQQGLLPGVEDEWGVSDGYRYSKKTGIVTPIPDWKPKTEAPYKVGARHKFTGEDGLTYEGTYKGLDKDNNPVFDKVVPVKGEGEGREGGGATFTKIEGEAFADFMESGYKSLTPQKKAIVDNKLRSDPDWGLAVKLAMEDIMIMQNPSAEYKLTAMKALYEKIKSGIGIYPYRDTGKISGKPSGGTPPYSGMPPLFPWKGPPTAGPTTQTEQGETAPLPSNAVARFTADPAMKDYRLGPKTEKGYEVYDKTGKLIGHYR